MPQERSLKQLWGSLLRVMPNKWDSYRRCSKRLGFRIHYIHTTSCFVVGDNINSAIAQLPALQYQQYQHISSITYITYITNISSITYMHYIHYQHYQHYLQASIIYITSITSISITYII